LLDLGHEFAGRALHRRTDPFANPHRALKSDLQESRDVASEGVADRLLLRPQALRKDRSLHLDHKGGRFPPPSGPPPVRGFEGDPGGLQQILPLKP